MLIEAIKNIKPGEEILVSYGREYWNLIRKILRTNSSNKTI